MAGMNRRIALGMVSICFLLFTGSCTTGYVSSVYQKAMIYPEGDTAVVMKADGTTVTGELLFIVDRDIYIFIPRYSLIPTTPPDRSSRQELRARPLVGEAVIVNLNAVHSIQIMGYANRNWVGTTLAFEIAPAVLLGLVGGIYMGEPESGLLITGALSLPTLLNMAIFAASTPAAPTFNTPFIERDVRVLSRYTRFPLGLTPEQRERFLQTIKNPG